MQRFERHIEPNLVAKLEAIGHGSKETTAAAPQGISKTFYHYDEAGHLIAETAPGSQPLLTYIWTAIA